MVWGDSAVLLWHIGKTGERYFLNSSGDIHQVGVNRLYCIDPWNGICRFLWIPIGCYIFSWQFLLKNWQDSQVIAAGEQSLLPGVDWICRCTAHITEGLEKMSWNQCLGTMYLPDTPVITMTRISGWRVVAQPPEKFPCPCARPSLTSVSYTFGSWV